MLQLFLDYTDSAEWSEMVWLQDHTTDCVAVHRRPLPTGVSVLRVRTMGMKYKRPENTGPTIIWVSLPSWILDAITLGGTH